MEAVHEYVPAPPKHNPFVDLVPEQGIRLTPKHYAYLKYLKDVTTVVPSVLSQVCVAI